MIKKILVWAVFLLTVLSLPSLAKERKQWTEKQAWQWEKKMGVILGFNQPEPPYPGMTRLQLLQKAKELGFNSVRFWVWGDDAEKQIEHIRSMAEDAASCGMTISPVLCRHERFFNAKGDEKENLAQAEKMVRAVVRPFAKDPRIALWDIWNEPGFHFTDSDNAANSNTLRRLEWIERMVHWCRAENLSQPITSSIIWDAYRGADDSSPVWEKRCQVEAMMDVHNFHSYECSKDFGADIYYTIERIRKISNRPIVCTEAMTRVNGSGVQRTLAVFAKEHVHAYLWGLYNNDANWAVKWSRSTYDPFEQTFHDFLWADGDPYDARELPFLRNFCFWDEGEDLDPGIPVTDRWNQERVWRRMAGAGLVKGYAGGTDPGTVPEGFNSLRIRVSFQEYRSTTGEQRSGFHARFKALLQQAGERGMTVLPILLTDEDLSAPLSELGQYVKDMVGRYYDDQTILGWDLYFHPGEKATSREKVEQAIDTVFAYARNQYPNQPVFMTPCVAVKPFKPDFDYRSALIHGRRRGWDMLQYEGVSNPDLVYKIWSLSDVAAFSSRQPSAETGWLLSICYRFGRPIFCTGFEGTGQEQEKILDLFARSHVYWFSSEDVPDKVMQHFKFIPIQTKH